MAIQYTNLDNLVADLLPELGSDEELEAISRTLDGVSAFVDSYCLRPSGYFLPAPEDPTDRRVFGEGRKFLRLPRHVFGSVASVSGLDLDNFYENSQGWLYPIASDAGLSYNASYVEDEFYLGSFPKGKAFAVSARWGFEATPDEISEAVRQITKRWFETQKGIFGQVTPAGFVVERDLPPSAELILKPFRRREFEVV